jgi:hypothetical protein
MALVWKTTDDGQSWEKISPDLTYGDPETLGVTGGLIIHTSRYSNPLVRQRRDLVKVGVTLVRPRWPLGFDPVWMDDLAPSTMFHLEDKEFNRQYNAKLEKIGVDRIIRQLKEISAQHGGKDLVLLGYDKVEYEGHYVCYRQTFANWFKTKTGVEIKELYDPGGTKKKKKSGQDAERPEAVEKPSLFDALTASLKAVQKAKDEM